ncbi:MAG TPA: hypothetical protein P5081_21790 [Phycisphaerae bacterium]|nr:hypothetical protein [Phycisphaerae bacterium]HRW55513.1 hypothetical protein [Phycisphaerae bacterium]
MADSNYVIVHCPKGHELQAAHEHLTATLSCPVCGIEFVPQAGAVPTMTGPQNLATSPVTYSASHLLTKPIQYPGVTSWMLGLWVVVTAMLIAQGVIGMVIGPTQSFKPNGLPDLNPGMLVFAIASGCMMWLGLAAACVLQLIWIYRIHDDAQRARGYDKISAIVATIVCFIPGFNMIWTALTMLWLSNFVAASPSNVETPDASALASKAVGICRWCLVVSVLFVVSFCGYTCYAILRAYKAALAVPGAMNGTANQAELQAKIQAEIGVTPLWVSIVVYVLLALVVYLYIRTVRATENALYPFLGAPAK